MRNEQGAAEGSQGELQVRQTAEQTVVTIQGLPEKIVLMPGKEGSLRRGPVVDDGTYKRLQEYAKGRGWTMEQLWLEGAVALVNDQLRTTEQVREAVERTVAEGIQQLTAQSGEVLASLQAREDEINQVAADLERQRQQSESAAEQWEKDMQRRDEVLTEQERLLDLRRQALTTLEEALTAREQQLARQISEMEASAQAHAEKALLERERALAVTEKNLAVLQARLEEREALLVKREQLILDKDTWLEYLEGRLRGIAGITEKGTPNEGGKEGGHTGKSRPK